MADQSPELLRETPTNIVTTQIPSGGLSAGQVEQPFRDASALLGKFSEDASDLAVPLAQRQATADLANQKVIRGPDGSVGVLNPASAMILGDAGKTYARAVQQGTSDQILASVRPDLAAIHAENPLDSAALGKANGAYLDKLASTTAGMGPAGAEVMRSARDLASQHQDAATMAGATNNIENTKKAILATIDDRKNALSALAATPDGPNKPEYDQAVKDYDDALGKLGSSPLYKMPPEYLALQRKEFMGELKGQQLVSQVDRTFDRKGKAEAQSELMQLFQNPDISREQASLLYRQGMAHLEFRSQDQVAGQKAADQAISMLQIGLAKGTISPSDPEIAGMRKQAVDSGYADGVQKIDALTKVYSAHKAVSALPAADQPAALGVPPTAIRDASGQPYVDTATGATLTGATTNRDGSPLRSPYTRSEVSADAKAGTANISARDLSSPDAYKARVAEIENPGGNPNAVSPTGAKGKYQFLDSTLRANGGVVGGDQEAAMDRLTASNQASLTRGLGRVPSPGELYLAHQQGDGGALQLLQHPTERAGDLVGDKAIRVNGGDPNSSAAAFTNMWVKKFENGAALAKPAMSANGIPFSDSDAAANPWLRAEYFRSLAESKPVRNDSFAAYETGSAATLKAGNPLSDDTVTGLAQLSHGDPEKEAKASELLGMNLALKAMQGGGGGGAPMSAPQIQQAIQDTFNAARDAPDHLHQVLATSAYNYFKEQEKWAADHPLQDAARRYKQVAPQPIDPQNPGALPDNIAYRGTLAQHYAELNRSPAPSIFDKDELPQIKGILANPDPAVKGNVYGAIANLPEAVRGATLKELGGNNPKDMAEAAAGSLMKEAPEIAQSIFHGQGLIASDKRFDPEGEGQQKVTFNNDMDAALPPSLFTKLDRESQTGGYATTMNMVKARYADLTEQTGKFEYSGARLKQAADEVTGGVLDHNGGSLIAPARGMTQLQFDQTLAGVTSNDLRGAMTLKGQPVTADYVRSSGKLESAGDGKYFVRVGDSPPVYAYDTSPAPPVPGAQGGGWQKFVLDLRNVKPSSYASPEAGVANWMQ